MTEIISAFKKVKALKNKDLKVKFDSFLSNFKSPRKSEGESVADIVKAISKKELLLQLPKKKITPKYKRNDPQNEVKIFKDKYLKEKIRNIEKPQRCNSSEIGNISRSIDNLSSDLKAKFRTFNYQNLDYDNEISNFKSYEKPDIIKTPKKPRLQSSILSKSSIKDYNQIAEECYGKRVTYGQRNSNSESKEYISDRYICNKTPLKQKITDKLNTLRNYTKDNHIRETKPSNPKIIKQNQNSERNSHRSNNVSNMNSMNNNQVSKYGISKNFNSFNDSSYKPRIFNASYNQTSAEPKKHNSKQINLYKESKNTNFAYNRQQVNRSIDILTKNLNTVSREQNTNENVEILEHSISSDSNNDNLRKNYKQEPIKIIEGYQTERQTYHFPQNDDNKNFNQYFNKHKMKTIQNDASPGFKKKRVSAPVLNIDKNFNQALKHQMQRYTKDTADLYQQNIIPQNTLNLQKTNTNDHVTNLMNKIYWKKLQNCTNRADKYENYTRTLDNKMKVKKGLAYSARIQNNIDTMILNQNEANMDYLFGTDKKR